MQDVERVRFVMWRKSYLRHLSCHIPFWYVGNCLVTSVCVVLILCMSSYYRSQEHHPVQLIGYNGALVRLKNFNGIFWQHIANMLTVAVSRYGSIVSCSPQLYCMRRLLTSLSGWSSNLGCVLKRNGNALGKQFFWQPLINGVLYSIYPLLCHCSADGAIKHRMV